MPELTARAGVGAAAFGVAGPVTDDEVCVTNLPWRIQRDRLAQALGLPAGRVALLNDLAATALGVLELPPSALVALTPAAREARNGPGAPGARAVIAAGTGLGEAVLHRVGERYSVLPTEAGHAGAAPADAEDDALIAWLRCELGDAESAHVSVEHILSGPGLHRLYRFHCARAPEIESAAVTRALDEADPAAVIGRHATAGDDVLCVRAGRHFVRFYAAEAGNLALRSLATGGVYIAGGMGIALRTLLLEPVFATAFAGRGRFSGLLATVPVWLVEQPDSPLIGAGLAARRSLTDAPA